MVASREWLTERGREAVVMWPVSSRIMARSMALRSSRTLPGQSWLSSRRAPSGLMPSMWRLNFLVVMIDEEAGEWDDVLGALAQGWMVM